MLYMAGFETFREHSEREASGEPYNEAFITRCREKALEYDKMDTVLRVPSLMDLKKSIPVHYRNKVFDGLKSFD